MGAGRFDAVELGIQWILATRASGVTFTVLVVNEAKLSAEQLARLWHWRLGHPAAKTPVIMSKKGLASEINVRHELQCKCPICVKAGFSKTHTPRNDIDYQLTVRKSYPPYWVVHVDASGGQESMGVPTYYGGIGEYHFVDGRSGAIETKLYSSTSQVVLLLHRFLIQVQASDWVVRCIVLDSPSVHTSDRMEALCDIWGVAIELSSARASEENAVAERAVREHHKIKRALAIGAPHLPEKTWGCRSKYADLLHYVRPSGANELSQSPFEVIRRRPPPLKSMFLKIYGCPVQFRQVKDWDSFATKTEERTIDGWFLGRDGRAVLVLREHDQKPIRVSRKVVRAFEGTYALNPKDNPIERRLAEVDSGDAVTEADDLPEPVRSVRTLREHIDGTAEGRSGESLADSLNQGESEYMEEQAKIEEEAAMKEMQEVKRALDEAEKKKPSFEKIKTKLQSLIKKIREKTTLLDGEQEQQLGKELENWKQPFTSSKPPESAKLADDSDTESEPNDINEPIDEAADAVSGKSKGEAMANGDQPAKPIKVYQMKPGMQVAIDTERFGAEYAKGKPKELTGTIVKKGKGGVMYVRYDIDDKVARSHWKHLRPVGAGEKTTLTSLIMTLSTLAVLAAQGMRSTKDNWPKSFFECLIRPDWRDWVEAVRKEMVGWDSNRVYERVRVRDTDPSKPIIPLGELYTIKRCGRHKYRQIALGNYLRAGFDYAATFATTVSADALRFFFALAVAADKVIRGLDVTTAYLQSEQRSVVYAYEPSHAEYSSLSMEELAVLRGRLRKLADSKGIEAVRKLGRRSRNSEWCWLLRRAVYGVPDAGNAFALRLQGVLKNDLGFKQCEVDPSVYVWRAPGTGDAVRAADAVGVLLADAAGTGEYTRGEQVEAAARFNGLLADPDYIVLISWTDDLRYFGTRERVKWFEEEIVKHLTVTIDGDASEFVAIDFTHDRVRGTLEAKQPKYWEKAVDTYAEYLPAGGPRERRVPMAPSTVIEESTDEKHEQAKHLPFRELIGTINFGAVHTKLEVRYALSLLARHMTNWTKQHFELAIKLLEYCWTTREIGLIWSRGLDPPQSTPYYLVEG